MSNYESDEASQVYDSNTDGNRLSTDDSSAEPTSESDIEVVQYPETHEAPRKRQQDAVLLSTRLQYQAYGVRSPYHLACTLLRNIKTGKRSSFENSYFRKAFTTADLAEQARDLSYTTMRQPGLPHVQKLHLLPPLFLRSNDHAILDLGIAWILMFKSGLSLPVITETFKENPLAETCMCLLYQSSSGCFVNRHNFLEVLTQGTSDLQSTVGCV